MIKVENLIRTLYINYEKDKFTNHQLNLSDFQDKSLLILDDDDPLRGRLSRAMEKKGFIVKKRKQYSKD